MVRAHDVEPLSLQERHVAEDLRADRRVLLDLLPLGAGERAALLQDLVGDADLADVVEQEAVLEAGVVEQRGVDSLGERQRVVLDALGVLSGLRILRLERVRERGDGLAVGVLQRAALRPLDLDDPAEVARVDEQLLGVGLRLADQDVAACLELVDQERISSSGLNGFRRIAFAPAARASGASGPRR